MPNSLKRSRNATVYPLLGAAVAACHSNLDDQWTAQTGSVGTAQTGSVDCGSIDCPDGQRDRRHRSGHEPAKGAKLPFSPSTTSVTKTERAGKGPVLVAGPEGIGVPPLFEAGVAPDAGVFRDAAAAATDEDCDASDARGPEPVIKTDSGQCGGDEADVDSDSDDTPDCDDGCPLNADKVEPGQCGCDLPDTDRDWDGLADCLDVCPLRYAMTPCGCPYPVRCSNL
jgi:hypothetical protein